MRRLPTFLALVCVAVSFFATRVHAEPANELNLTQCVRPSTVGQFQAKVIVPMSGSRASVVPNANVTLFGGKGAVHRGKTNIHGDVSIAGVEPGVYAITAQAKGLFACYSMHVLGADQATQHACPDSADVSCALVSSQQFGATVMPYLASEADRAEIKVDDSTLVKQAYRPAGDAMYRVTRSGDGLRGNLRSASDSEAKQMNVFLFRNRVNIGRTVSDETGQFEFAKLPSGVYSLVAVGPNGLAALGFELVDEVRGSASVSRDGRTLVNQVAELIAPSLVVDVIPLTEEELDGVIEEEEEEEEDEEETGEEADGEETLDAEDEFVEDQFGNPMAGGGYAPGAGGGGAGGGGGGAGGIGGIGALAALGAAAASSSNGGGFFVPPASPVTPAPAPAPAP